MQQSSSYRSPVPKKGHTCRCQPETTVREPFFPQFPCSQRVRSMKIVSFTMLKAEKAWVWQTPQTLCWEDSWLLTLLCEGFQESCCYQESNCLFQSKARMSRAFNKFCHAGCWKNTSTCASRRVASLANWCCIHAAIHFISIINTEEREHMQVSASDHCERTIFFPVSILAKRVSYSQCWKLRKLELGRHLGPCVGKIVLLLLLLCDRFRGSCRNQESHWMFQFKAGMSRALNIIEQLLPCRKNTSACASSMSFQSCRLMGRSCNNPAYMNHQYWRKGRHAGISQWPLWEIHSLPSFHSRQKSVFFSMLKAEKAWAWRTPQTLSWEDSLVADAAVLRLPGIMLPVPVPGKNEQNRALKKFCHAGRI